jgi:integrase family protein
VKLGEYELNELTPLVLQRYITELIESGNMKTGKGLAANSVNGIITVIQNSLKLAYALGTIKEYAADKIRRPKTKEKEVTCFTLSEQKKIERAALAGKKTKWLGIVVCLYTGLRIGELLALEWKDVDFQKGVLTVSKSRHEGKDENGRYAHIVESPKTVSSGRCIPLPKQILCELRMLKRKSRSAYVISNGERSIPVRSYQRSFERLLKKLDIPHKGFHALRHTFATRALECGMDVKMLSELLGHKDPAVTLRRYVHSLMEQKKEMMNKVGNTYFKEAK